MIFAFLRAFVLPSPKNPLYPEQILGAAKPLKKFAFIRVNSWLNGFAFGCGGRNIKPG